MKRHLACATAFGVALGCLVLFVASISLFSGAARWMSDPAAVRPPTARPSGAPPWGDYSATLAESPSVASVDPRSFDSFSVTTNESDVTIVSPTALQPRDEVSGYTVHRVGPDQRFAINDGAIELKYVGVAYAVSPPGSESNSSLKLPGRFFRARSLEPLAGEEFEREIPDDRHRQLQFHGRFPAVQLSFALKRLDEFQFLSIAAYDARTKRSILVGGYSGDRRNDSESHFNVDLRVWHQTPVEVVLTVAHGPLEVFSIESKVGETIRHARGEMRLIAVTEGKVTGGSGTGSGGTNIAQVHLNRPPGQLWTAYVFASLTPARFLPLGFEFFDTAGHRIPSEGGMGMGGQIRVASLAAGADAVSQIQTRLYRHIKRLVFRLPQIPGLPPENRQVQNLFDVRIPYARVRADYDLWNLLEDTLQMKITRGASRPSPYFPHSYTNVTTADLLHEYRKHATTNQMIRVDSASHQIEIKPHPLVELWLRAQKFVTRKK